MRVISARPRVINTVELCHCSVGLSTGEGTHWLLYCFHNPDHQLYQLQWHTRFSGHLQARLRSGHLMYSCRNQHFRSVNGAKSDELTTGTMVDETSRMRFEQPPCSTMQQIPTLAVAEQLGHRHSLCRKNCTSHVLSFANEGPD